jgi:hypothetical protein
MKKYFVIAVAAVFCLALAMPAGAELKITGSTSMDAYWSNLSSEFENGGVAHGATGALNDRTAFHMNTYRPLNYIRFTYTNDDATAGIVMRLRTGWKDAADKPGSGQMEMYDNNIWWKPMPGTKITIGTQNQIVGGYGMDTHLLGHQYESGTVVGITWGNTVHTSQRDGIVLQQKINDMIGIEAGIYDPRDVDTNTGDNQLLGILQGQAGGANANRQIVMPRFDLGVPIKFGNFRVKPKGSILVTEFDQVGSNTSDDSYTTWIASIDARFTYGPLRLTGEYTIGENTSGHNYSGPVGDNARGYVDANGIAQIADGEIEGWFISARYQFTKKLYFAASYGWQEGKNDINPAITTDDELTERSAVGFLMSYSILPNFLVRPQYNRYNYGEDNKRRNDASNALYDDGTIDCYGVNFVLLW